jgi:NADH:ubiquinone oxidoreductase subunit F (NADH-binding)
MLRRAVTAGPQGVIRELKDAKLLGRGGAAFPIAVKWEAVATNPVRPHYVVCNADESEPGTFKDRVLMEEDPYALLEALTIMGYCCGAEQGYIYIRGEYPLAEARLLHAVAQARTRGFLGPDVIGEGFAFDIEGRGGAGAYIAGEETALINSIEGKRAEPRNKPPSRRRSASSASRPPSTTWRRCCACWRSCGSAAPPSRRSAPRAPPAPGCSACPAASSGPACTSTSSGSRCAR